LENNPVSSEVKALVVPVSVVLLLAVVGFVIVLQQTPLAVIVDPPSLVTFPPEEAEISVIDDIEVVVTNGIDVIINVD
jgi:hypothetical protein